MIARLLRRPAAGRALSRLDHPEAIALAMVLAIVAAIGWLASPFWLAVAVGAQLSLGGLGAVWLIGPARIQLGLARYGTLASAAVALTLFGRLLIPSAGLLLAPVAAFLLWTVLRIELEVTRTGRSGVLLDLALVVMVFGTAAGIGGLVPLDAWPPGLLLVVLGTAIPALRAAEARGRAGAEAVGQAVLHLIAVGQIGAALALLQLPGVVGAAILALAFHAWSGAAEALDGGASARSVIIEFGALAVLGLVVALLLHGA
ncbi:MAG TPA: hypothetical protein VEW45_00785 [Candidatus Dormibacteraeota bacterium]|nr:hypothetical protein [Candidatus Dormibacteraeota bacterium]